MTEEDLIQESIKAAYGSLSQPTWHFASSAYRSHPYGEVVECLTDLGYQVNEVTDLNEDVSCSYLLLRDGFTWALYLSLVGPYAALLRVSPGDSEAPYSWGENSEVEGVLREHKVTLLSGEQLSRTIGFGANQEEKSIFAIMFSEYDRVLPGKW